MSWSSVSDSAGLVSTLPSTETRPSAISFSASRREHRPARASSLAMRSPFAGAAASVMGSALGSGDEGGEEARVAVADGVFRMPLHADEKTPARILDALDDAIGRYRVDHQPRRQVAHRLVMGGVDRQLVDAGDAMQQRAAGDLHHMAG